MLYYLGSNMKYTRAGKEKQNTSLHEGNNLIQYSSCPRSICPQPYDIKEKKKKKKETWRREERHEWNTQERNNLEIFLNEYN